MPCDLPGARLPRILPRILLALALLRAAPAAASSDTPPEPTPQAEMQAPLPWFHVGLEIAGRGIFGAALEVPITRHLRIHTGYTVDLWGRGVPVEFAVAPWGVEGWAAVFGLGGTYKLESVWATGHDTSLSAFATAGYGWFGTSYWVRFALAVNVHDVLREPTPLPLPGIRLGWNVGAR